ncbi:MAG: PD-(D/E)XK motif protein [Mesorhizobium sp.]|nr:PD-(D/E)XK motif protein [Mesorhizobium sp. M4A.F.Ca.ET.029.04.2.1]TIW75329.1 MAG: PD-(D/E)XK motif protein [Mesorhizobium sp.]
MASNSDSPPALLLPTWEALRRDYIEAGLPGRIVIRPSPKIELFVELGGSRLGALLALPAGSSVPPTTLTDVSIAEVRDGTLRCLQIATDTPALFGTFYLLLTDVIGSLLYDGADPILALTASLSDWRTLLQTSALLSEERQLGLLGELWLLERLIAHSGSDALDSWVGPSGQSHDFRRDSDEFEVKTTSSPRRVHIINGVDQLAPSPNARLHLLSIRYIDAGSGGESLPEIVDRIHRRLEIVPGAASRFSDKLNALGYRSGDAVHYSRRRRIADQPRLIAVGDGVPRLTAEALSDLPNRFATPRISDVVYRVDVDGMGVEDGHPYFLTLLPTEERKGTS